jgi:hypothetical protein
LSSTAFRVPGRLREHRGLPDARLAGQQQELAVPVAASSTTPRSRARTSSRPTGPALLPRAAFRVATSPP